MPNLIPGRDQVIQMALAGTPPGEIARQTGLSINTVSADVSFGRRQGLKIPVFPRGRKRKVGVTFRVGPEIVAVLQPGAEKRKISVERFAERLMERIARDGLIDAILDDGGEA